MSTMTNEQTLTRERQGDALLAAFGAAGAFRTKTGSTAGISRRELDQLICNIAVEGLLEPFRGSVWRRRLYEALAWMETGHLVERRESGYVLTEAGKDKYRDIKDFADVVKVREQISDLLKSS